MGVIDNSLSQIFFFLINNEIDIEFKLKALFINKNV
jgi:hypothetical protein